MSIRGLTSITTAALVRWIMTLSSSRAWMLLFMPKELSVIVPYGLAGARETNVIVEMDFNWRSVPVRIEVWPARLVLFTTHSSGKGQRTVLNQDGSLNSTLNPSAKESVIVFYATGGGELSGDRLALPTLVLRRSAEAR